ncbi:MAG: imidazole glycerol phosphate synthase subunit HisH [Rubrivivax sp.]|nr:imidazole glycerol phosphate synthase subunit HisH [Rubrivivax sp.]
MAGAAAGHDAVHAVGAGRHPRRAHRVQRGLQRNVLRVPPFVVSLQPGTRVIAIVDYDIGNLGAVANMLRRLGADCEITAERARIEAADRLILPGNGAFDACMHNLRASGLVPVLEAKVRGERTPLLGICVGAQMLGHGSEEGCEAGLGWLNLCVKRFPARPGLRVPHMGWNDVRVEQPAHPLAAGMGEDTRFYFVHSYFLEPADPADVLFTADYGGRFAAGIAHGNLAGVQFHPEKSHRYGKRLLANFAGASL